MRNFIDLFNDTTPTPAPQSKQSLLTALEESVLLEGKHFEAMFSTLEALGQRYHEDMILEEVEKAKTVIRQLRKSDRQAWAARIIRLWLFSRIEGWTKSDFTGAMVGVQHDDAMMVRKAEQFVTFKSEVAKLHGKYMGEYQKVTGEAYEASSDDPTRIIQRQIINHYFGMPYSKIQNYQFGAKSLEATLADLRALEEEFKTRTKALLTLHSGDEIILKLGNDMCWVMLGRGYCSEEANAMGHCGNAGARSGDRILSLRRLKDTIDGVGYFEVFLTFILQHDGFLGEMKGRANEKPAQRYHDAIIALLKLPIIKGIRGGGYAPANNFAMKDLTDDQREALIDSHPHLGGFEARLKKQGDSPELRAAIISSLKEKLPSWASNVTWNEEGELILIEFKDVQHLVNDISENKLAQQLAGSDGDRPFDYDWDSASDDEITSLIDSLPMQYQIKLGAIASDLAKESMDEDDFEAFDPSSSDEVLKVFEEDDYDTYHALKGAVISGMESGAEGAAHEALVKALEELKRKVQHGRLEFKTYKNAKGEDKMVWDSPIAVVCSIKEACGVADAADATNEDEYEYDDGTELNEFVFGMKDGDDPIELDEPYYGWSGFDEEYAISRVLDEIDFGEVEKKPEGIDFETMPLPEVKQWLRDMYARIPDGFVREVEVDELSEERVRAAAVGLFKTYYG